MSEPKEKPTRRWKYTKYAVVFFAGFSADMVRISILNRCSYSTDIFACAMPNWLTAIFGGG